MRSATLPSFLLATAFLLNGCGGDHGPVRSPHSAPGYAEPTVSSSDATGSAAPNQPSHLSERGWSAPEPSQAPTAGVTPPPSRGLGTSWGEYRYSPVVTTSFERASASAADLLQVRYDDWAGVRRRTSNWGPSAQADLYARKTNVRLALEGSSRRRFPASWIGGELWAVGTLGASYRVAIANENPWPVEVVVSVDGVDVISGEDADLHHRGYVINAHENLNIDGFRQSDQGVASFRFGATDDSYASRTGRPRNVGVIAAAIFHPRGAEWRDTANPFPSQSGYAQPPP